MALDQLNFGQLLHLLNGEHLKYKIRGIGKVNKQISNIKSAIKFNNTCNIYINYNIIYIYYSYMDIYFPYMNMEPSLATPLIMLILNDVNKINTFSWIVLEKANNYLQLFTKLKFEDTKYKHGRPYWIWKGLLFWQLETSGEVMEVDKQLKFKSHKHMQVNFISNNIDVMTATVCLVWP